jgi:hypothetical protein
VPCIEYANPSLPASRRRTVTREMPIRFEAGLFSLLPDTPWIGWCLANNGRGELRCAGQIIPTAVVRSTGFQPVVLQKNNHEQDAHATYRRGSLELLADADCEVEVFRLLRAVDFEAGPTWREFAPGAFWDVLGAIGDTDAAPLGLLSLRPVRAETLTGPGVEAALRDLLDGQTVNLLVRRCDQGEKTIEIRGRAILEFTPPAAEKENPSWTP